jgi:trans-2,3-dihydro-3-hydroxyanthranilate isomerase
MTLRELLYTVLDVFAERALEGNPLAVFHDASGLTAMQMQAIAREMRLSETTFVLPQQSTATAVRVRIFTTEEELPFAGHPTLGTAAWLYALRLRHSAAQQREAASATVVLKLDAGEIPVTFEAPVAGEEGFVGTMRQNDPAFGESFDRAEVARVIGMREEDLLDSAPPQSVSTGNAFCIVALKSVEVMATLQIPQREATAWLRDRGMRWFYGIAPQSQRGSNAGEDAPLAWRARMQFYGGEDPATGSAAGPCIAWLVRHGLVAADTPTVLLQGVEIARPSRLIVQASRTHDVITNVLVGGRTIVVAEGRLFLPE